MNKYCSCRLCVVTFLLLTMASCSIFKKKKKQDDGQVSTVTGIPYNETETQNSFTIDQYLKNPQPPNLVHIEGGTFAMGLGVEDVIGDYSTPISKISVQSFYMDRTEIANIHWLEFIAFYENEENQQYIPSNLTFEEYRKEILLPDTTVWAREATFNDAYVSNYLRYPGFRFYPVVGVSWVQAQEFCKWRTLAVNITQDAEVITEGEDIQTGTTLSEDMPSYRLPTEEEWEYAARALVGVEYQDKPINRVYPWDGHYLRNPYQKNMGKFLANFKRGRGDYAGIAGKQNDGAMLTSWIYAYPPNDFGLYNMAGNVNEWVENVFKMEDKYGISETKLAVRLSKRLDTTQVLTNNMSRAYIDSTMQFPSSNSFSSYYEGLDSVRAYKGGSWNDVAYWLSPGTRRFLNMNSSSATIGFRCAMTLISEDK